MIDYLWDKYPSRLIIFILDIHGVNLTKGCHLRLLYGKQKYKTEMAVQIDDSIPFNQLFFFHVDSDMELLVELVTTNKMGIDKVIGIASLGYPNQLTPELLVDSLVRMMPKSKKGNDKFEGEVNIHVRYLFSTHPTSRPVNELNAHNSFFYEKYKRQFKTGDLILYNEVGTIPTIQKLLDDGNNHFNRVGMIVELPNKWTHKKKLFILEIFPNHYNSQDSFLGEARAGVSLFKLKERIHTFQGTQIWWSPLDERIDEDAEQNLLEYIWLIHNNGVNYFPSEYLANNILDFFSRTEGISISRLEQSNSLLGIKSTKIFLDCLRIAGKRVNYEDRHYHPSELFYTDILGVPVLLRRTRNDDDSPYIPGRNTEHLAQNETVVDSPNPPLKPTKVAPPENSKKVPPAPPKKNLTLRGKKTLPGVPPKQRKPLPVVAESSSSTSTETSIISELDDNDEGNIKSHLVESSTESSVESSENSNKSDDDFVVPDEEPPEEKEKSPPPVVPRKNTAPPPLPVKQVSSVPPKQDDPVPPPLPLKQDNSPAPAPDPISLKKAPPLPQKDGTDDISTSSSGQSSDDFSDDFFVPDKEPAKKAPPLPPKKNPKMPHRITQRISAPPPVPKRPDEEKFEYPDPDDDFDFGTD